MVISPQTPSWYTCPVSHNLSGSEMFTDCLSGTKTVPRTLTLRLPFSTAFLTSLPSVLASPTPANPAITLLFMVAFTPVLLSRRTARIESLRTTGDVKVVSSTNDNHSLIGTQCQVFIYTSVCCVFKREGLYLAQELTYKFAYIMLPNLSMLSVVNLHVPALYMQRTTNSNMLLCLLCRAGHVMMIRQDKNFIFATHKKKTIQLK